MEGSGCGSNSFNITDCPAGGKDVLGSCCLPFTHLGHPIISPPHPTGKMLALDVQKLEFLAQIFSKM